MFRSIPVLTLAATVAIGQQPCPNGQLAPDLGYGLITCHDCLSSWATGGTSILRFTGQPAVFRIRADGPGAGKLSEGDTLVSINGLAITSDGAALALARWKAGAMTVGVRHKGSVSTVRITPLPVCVSNAELPVLSVDSLTRAFFRLKISEDDLRLSLNGLRKRLTNTQGQDSTTVASLLDGLQAQSASLANATRDVDRLGELLRQLPKQVPTPAFERAANANTQTSFPFANAYAVHVSPDTYAPGASSPPNMEEKDGNGLGMTLSCTACRVRIQAGQSTWTFGQLPIVASVEAGSFADRVGLRRGDTLTAIDGQSVLTAQGSNKLTSTLPGTSMRITWKRGGKTQSGVAAPGNSTKTAPLRSTERVGGSSVEIRGNATWSRDPATGALRISGDSITVIVTPPAGGRDTLRAQY